MCPSRATLRSLPFTYVLPAALMMGGSFISAPKSTVLAGQPYPLASDTLQLQELCHLLHLLGLPHLAFPGCHSAPSLFTSALLMLLKMPLKSHPWLQHASERGSVPRLPRIHLPSREFQNWRRRI